MTTKELIQWQYSSFAKFHQSKLNLWIHIVAVPIFVSCFCLLILGIFTFNLNIVFISMAGMVGSIVIQGVGHKKEQLPPEAFTGPINVIVRIFLEQTYTFPKFVFTGGWAKAMRGE